MAELKWSKQEALGRAGKAGDLDQARNLAPQPSDLAGQLKALLN